MVEAQGEGGREEFTSETEFKFLYRPSTNFGFVGFQII
jgi:hypothetical protein